MIDLLGGKALVVLLTAAFAAIPPGPGYRVNVTADTNTPPPDGSGNFSAWGALNPSLDRRYVVFENITPPSIYTYDTATSKFYKIADLSTNFPGTATPFTSFFAGYNDPNSPIVAKGKVVFWGSNGTTNAIFSAPANSGPITKIVASGDAVPTGGNFTTIFRRLTTDGDSGVILNSGDIGVGYDDWYFPTISNGQVWVLAAVGASDPARAKSAIFTTSTPLVSDVYPYTGPARPATVYSSTNMPGNTNANFHTRYDAFALNNGTLAVIADDSFGKYAGVFLAPAAPGQTDAPLTRLIDNTTSPNLSFEGSLGIANENGNVYFAVRDLAKDNTVAIYAVLNGKAPVLVAQVGVPLFNRPGEAVRALAAGISLNGVANGTIAFSSNAAFAVYLAVPDVATVTSVGTAYGTAAISQNTWTQINGIKIVPANTPAAGANWNNELSFAQGLLPTSLQGVSVTVNGKPGFISFYCSAATSQVCTSDQINVLTPLDTTTGPVQIVVTSSGVASAPITATLQPLSPTFLLFAAPGYVAATHADNSLLAPASLYPGFSTPAAPGEIVVLYAIGFGLPSNGLVNGSSTQSGPLPSPVTCAVGGANAPVQFAGVVTAGLYQLNVALPQTLKSGDNPISCSYAGATTPQAFITIK